MGLCQWDGSFVRSFICLGKKAVGGGGEGLLL